MDTPHRLLGTLLGCGPFLLKLLVGSLLFSTHFRRKERFRLRLLLAFGIELPLGVLLYLLCYFSGWWPVQNTLCFLLLFLLSLPALFAAFDEPPTTLILCAVSGYMTEHISAQCLQMLAWWDPKAWMVTGRELGAVLSIFAAQLLVFALVAAAVYVLFAKRTTYVVQSKTVERRMFWLSVTTLLVVLVLSSARDAYAGESFALMVVSRLLSIFCCVFLLYIRSEVLEKNQLEQEREELRRLYELERERYEQSRENIELINIKCHDLKHRIEGWERRDGQVPPEEIQEMKRLVGIYDSSVKTGNDTLDTLLTERSLYCEKQGIRLSCMVDGKKLSFMPVGDVCALFGNAVENAIEAVSRLERAEERCISFMVRESRGMLVATIDNYFSGPLEFEDGLPKTTKGEAGWHGYGLKSIRRVAEKYGGQAAVLVDEMFHLTILIPLPEPKV